MTPRILFLLFVLAGPAAAAEVRVAADASMATPLQRIAAAFHRDTGNDLVITTAATGKLYEQVVHGAPYEVLLAADEDTAKRLESQGLARPETRFNFATGKLVLWSAREGAVDGRGEVLRQPPTGRLAISDPHVSPYGVAAVEALRNLGQWSAWQPQLLQAENVTQAFQFASGGRAVLALIALSQVAEDGRIARGYGWVVPPNLYPPLDHDAVLLNAGAGNPAAIAFLAYLRSNAARAILRAAGYVI